MFQRCSFPESCDTILTSLVFLRFLHVLFSLQWFSIIDHLEGLNLGLLICDDDLDEDLFAKGSQKCKGGLFEILFTINVHTLKHSEL